MSTKPVPGLTGMYEELERRHQRLQTFLRAMEREGRTFADLSEAEQEMFHHLRVQYQDIADQLPRPNRAERRWKAHHR